MIGCHRLLRAFRGGGWHIHLLRNLPFPVRFRCLVCSWRAQCAWNAGSLPTASAGPRSAVDRTAPTERWNMADCGRLLPPAANVGGVDTKPAQQLLVVVRQLQTRRSRGPPTLEQRRDAPSDCSSGLFLDQRFLHVDSAASYASDEVGIECIVRQAAYLNSSEVGLLEHLRGHFDAPHGSKTLAGLSQ